MANIHAINAQGTEYGITAENGITQEQVDAIATIGDVSNLSTTAKTTLVAAVNEVNGKLPNETVLYENPNPTAGQGEQEISVSGITNAKALKIIYGSVSSNSCFLKEETYPIMQGKGCDIFLSQVNFTADDTVQSIRSRKITLNSSRVTLNISRGSYYEYDFDDDSRRIVYTEESAKVIKIVALF